MPPGPAGRAFWHAASIRVLLRPRDWVEYDARRFLKNRGMLGRRFLVAHVRSGAKNTEVGYAVHCVLGACTWYTGTLYLGLWVWLHACCNCCRCFANSSTHQPAIAPAIAPACAPTAYSAAHRRIPTRGAASGKLQWIPGSTPSDGEPGGCRCLRRVGPAHGTDGRRVAIPPPRDGLWDPWLRQE